MSTSRLEPVEEARKDLGRRLRGLRKAAGLTGPGLGEITAMHPSRISRIENGVQLPSERDIADWCTACGFIDHIPDLIATAGTVESAYLEWTKQARAGMRHLGEPHSIATYRKTVTFRIHEPIVMPGIFQTETYLRRMLAYWYDYLDSPDDTDATVNMRAQRTATALHP